MTAITATRVLTPDGIVGPARVVVDGGTIAAVEPVGSAPDLILAPGFVDLQVNGVDDVDVAGASSAVDWDRLDRLVAAQGVTTWCPTIVTAPLPRLDAALALIGDAMARPPAARPRIAGAHVEGPFLGGAPGAHPREWLRPIDADWLAALPGHVGIVTIAPELAGAPAAIAALTARDVVVSLGHSTATAVQVRAAVDAGATMVTHVFNGMGPLHHREPGLAGTALTDDRLACGLIADGVHVDPALIPLVFRASAVALVTDAVAWRAGRAGGIEVDLVEGAPRLADGTLAGSALTMDRAVATCVAAGVPLAEALAAASTVPAGVLRLDDRGRIEPGRRADLVALDADLRPVATWAGGAQIA